MEHIVLKTHVFVRRAKRKRAPCSLKSQIMALQSLVGKLVHKQYCLSAYGLIERVTWQYNKLNVDDERVSSLGHNCQK